MSGKYHRWLLRGMFFLWLVLLFSCAVNPVTGKREFMLISESEELRLGEQSDAEIIRAYGLYPDPELEQYLTNLGKKLVAVSHRPTLKFHFRLLDSPVINAFAVPGGYVYITRGILAYLNSEAELAGVMGHEIGHVTARHSAKQITKAQLAQLGLGLGSLLSDQFRKYAYFAQFGVGMLFLKFSRDHERQSDELGVEYASKVGYDARQMANFFVTLQRMQPREGGGLPDWFSTHPNPANRVATIRRLAREWQQKLNPAGPWKVNREVYLRKIDGLVFGEDPRQGFVENNRFYHPEMRFQFPVPTGWNVQNTPTQVQMQSSDKKALIVFTLSQAKTPTEAAEKFVRETKAVVVSTRSVTVHGFPARRLEANLISEEGTVRILSYFIRKGERVFLFVGLAEAEDFSAFLPRFEATMTGFAALRDAAKLNMKPDRLRIKTVPRTAALETILRSFGITSRQELEQTALINGRELTETVQKGTLLKVIQRGK